MGIAIMHDIHFLCKTNLSIFALADFFFVLLSRQELQD